MSTCTKKPYPTPNAALMMLAILKKRGYTQLKGVHPCADCNAWHTTSKKQSGRKKHYSPRRGAA